MTKPWARWTNQLINIDIPMTVGIRNVDTESHRRGCLGHRMVIAVHNGPMILRETHWNPKGSVDREISQVA